MAQTNLVSNGGFEKGKKGIFIASAYGWKGMGTVDYYRSPLQNDMVAKPGARSGKGYAGLRFQWDYKEFMHTKLSEPLKSGVAYQYTMWVRLVNVKTVTMSLRAISGAFTTAPYKLSDVIDQSNSVGYYEKKGIGPDYQWLEISGTYIAKGGERYLTIGNFSENVRKDFVKMRKFAPFIFHEAYYFVDDISLVEGGGPVRKPQVVEDTVQVKHKPDTLIQMNPDYKTGQVVKMENINFETGSSMLLASSFDELDQLAQLLEDNPKMEIQVNGHTDNQGDEKKNKQLSEDRAKAVREYITAKGVKNRIVTRGFGSSKPLAKNNTEEGRSLNRRVEFVILKQ